MARIFAFLAWILVCCGSASIASAQVMLADLAHDDAPRTLLANGPAQTFIINLPDNPGQGSFTLSAWPDEPAPPPGLSFFVSVNEGPAIAFTPAIRPFNARFSIPAGSFRAGRNTLAIWVEPIRDGTCIPVGTGNWHISLMQSRLDVAISARPTKLHQLEDRLAASIGAPQRIAMDLLALHGADQYRAGALLAQALSLRAGSVPELAAANSLSDLIIRTQIGTGPHLALYRWGQTPVLRISGANDAEILQVIDWLAQYRLPADVNAAMMRQHPSQWPKKALRTKRDLRTQLRETGTASIRIAPSSTARLLIDMGANPNARVHARLAVQVDGEILAQPVLWRRMNSLAFDLPGRSVPDRTIQIRVQPVQHGPQTCKPDPGKLRDLSDLQMAKLQVSGMNRISPLEDLAVNGGVIVRNGGKNTLVALPASSTARLQAWRVLGRLALISGSSLIHADYVQAQRELQTNNHDVLWIGNRDSIPPTISTGLPASFAPNRGQAPGDPPKDYPHLPRVKTAQAAEPDPLGAVGVAASASLPGGRTALVLSAETDKDLPAALADLAQGTSLSQFAGTVVRWRGDRVMVNATMTNIMAMPYWPRSRLGLFFMSLLLIIMPLGAWSSLHMIVHGRPNSH